jgi:hypothetical protein
VVLRLSRVGVWSLGLFCWNTHRALSEISSSNEALYVENERIRERVEALLWIA